MLASFGSSRLPAQSLFPSPFIDSVLSAVAATNDATFAVRPEQVVCRNRERGLVELCQGLVLARIGSDFRVAGGVLSKSAPIGIDLSFRETPSEYLNADVNTGIGAPYAIGFPPANGEAGRRIASGRQQLLRLAASHPDWDVVWYALGMSLLQIDDASDSAMVLFARARQHGHLSPGVLDLAMAEALSRRGDLLSGAAALRLATTDSSFLVHSLLKTWLGRVLPRDALTIIDGIAVRAAGTINDPDAQLGLLRLIQERFRWAPITNPLLVQVRRYVLTDEHGPGIAVAMAIFRQNLGSTQAFPGDPREVFPLRISVVAIRDSDGLMVTLDTLRRLISSSERPRSPQLDRTMIAVAEVLPLPPGRYHLLATVRQPDGGGAFLPLPAVTIPGTAPVGMWLGDLVVGREENSIPWRGPTDSVRFNPAGEWGKADRVPFFVQMGGMKVGAPYQVTIRFTPIPFGPSFRVGKVATGKEVQLHFEEVAQATHFDWYRVLGIQSLQEGIWCVSLSIRQGAVTLTGSDVLLLGRLTESWYEWMYYRYLRPQDQACFKER